MRAISFAKVSILLIAACVTACQTKPTHAPETSQQQLVHDKAGAVRYQVDSAASKLHVLVYRGGSMARLGHNHVVSSNAVQGALFLQKDFARSSIELTLPVASLIVDDASARASEGEDFVAEVPQEARDGTRRNMFRPEVLDAEHFPGITLQSVAMSGTRNHPTLTMRITIKDVSRDVPVAASISENNGEIVASGEFAVKQTDFGITPFSVALGALQVQDQLKIKFSIVCRQQK